MKESELFNWIKSKNHPRNFKPIFLYPSKSEDLEKILYLKSSKIIESHDTIYNQISEWLKTQNPAKALSSRELKREARDYLGQKPDLFGVWVFYPWIRTLVHLLDKDKFIQLRTNRNKQKITEAEQKILSQKKIGIAGLSVGQSVALAIALERISGEIRLADFDNLELSNLNRIQASVYHLGIPKVIIAARRIAELDPFLKVKCFLQGLLEKNMTAFFTQGGKIDIFIEECDSFEIKILSRLKARELKIPVLMDTSDRGLLDIERFDLKPKSFPLHGNLKKINLEQIKKIKELPPLCKFNTLLDLERLSARLKASLLSMNSLIVGIPQLGSSVLFGGAITADVCRRILLDELHVSGEFFEDPEDLIHDEIKIKSKKINKNAKLNQKKMIQLIDQLKSSQKIKNQVSLKLIQNLVQDACLAPSGGNVQPWKWMYKNSQLFLFIDPMRASSYLDFKRGASYLALGAASENLLLSAKSHSLETQLNLFPLKRNRNLVGSFAFSSSKKKNYSQKNSLDNLVPWIHSRVTNRRNASKAKLKAKSLQQLCEITKGIPGTELQIIKDKKTRLAIAKIIGKAEVIRLRIPETHADLISEIRWNNKETKTMKDGIDIETVELKEVEKVVLKMLKDHKVVQLLDEWKQLDKFEAPYIQTASEAPALGLLRVPDYSPASCFNGGRALQRIWLQANALGISIHPMSAFLFLFQRASSRSNNKLKSSMQEELLALQKRFQQCFPELKQGTPLFLFRMFNAKKPTKRSLRRPLEEVFTVIK